MDLRALMLVVLMLMTPLSGCFAPEETVEVTPALSVEGVDGANGTLQVERGMYHTLSITSNVDYTVTPGPSMFLQDNTGTHRVGALTYPASTTSVTFLVLDSEASGTNLSVTAGEAMVWIDLTFVDASELMLVDGERAYETIDILTSQYNNRWCASAGPGGINHEGGAAYEAAAEAMALKMWDFGFDHVEVTRYPDDPDQLNVVGYNWGNVNPDEYIVIGGHFDIAYAFTPPSGGTNEGANDDTSGSTVSLEMGQALAQMEFDHTVVQALWACEEEGLLGSLAYVANLPENVSVRAYMNFDMVALNYPIVPLTEPIIDPLTGDIFEPTKYDWSISIAGASQANMERMMDMVTATIEDDLAYTPTEGNPIYWQIAESCASDHCAFFSAGYPTFNFFSPGGDISFWQEWHSPSDTLEFMTAKAGGQAGMASGFNSLVWSSMDLFIRVDNAENFHGTWKE